MVEKSTALSFRRHLGVPCENYDRLVRIYDDILAQYMSKRTVVDFPQMYLHKVVLSPDNLKFWIPRSYDILLAIHIPRGVNFTVTFDCENKKVECTCDQNTGKTEFLRIVPFSPFLPIVALPSWCVTFIFCHPCTVYFEYMVLDMKTCNSINIEKNTVCFEKIPPQLFEISSGLINRCPLCLLPNGSSLTEIKGDDNTISYSQSTDVRSESELDSFIKFTTEEGYRVTNSGLCSDPIAGGVFRMIFSKYQGNIYQ